MRGKGDHQKGGQGQAGHPLGADLKELMSHFEIPLIIQLGDHRGKDGVKSSQDEDKKYRDLRRCSIDSRISCRPKVAYHQDICPHDQVAEEAYKEQRQRERKQLFGNKARLVRFGYGGWKEFAQII
jgi:hypothetical protein